MKNIIVADSCALILLAKCGILELLAEAIPVIIPVGVYKEVVNKELLKKYADAVVISDLVSKKRIKVVPVKHKSFRIPISMDKGEVEALVLATQTTAPVVATDDRKAIKACRYLKIPFIISPKIAIELYRTDKIDFERVKSGIEKMKIIGRYSPDIIAEALLEVEVIRNAKNSHRQGS